MWTFVADAEIMDQSSRDHVTDEAVPHLLLGAYEP